MAKRYIPKTPRKKSWTGGNREDREQGQLMAWIKSRYPESYPETLCTTDLAGNKRTAPHGGQAICPTKPPQRLARHYDIRTARTLQPVND